MRTEDLSVTVLASRAVSTLVSRRSLGRSGVSQSLLDELIDAALNRGMDDVSKTISAIRAAGFSSADVIGRFIPDAARHMGQAWADDGLGFAEVTIGSARLQRVLRAMSSEGPRGRTGSNVLVVVPEGEQHTLGAMVATEQMRRAGVSVRLSLGERMTHIADNVANTRYDAVFLSTADTERVAETRRTTTFLRRAMAHPTPIVVGGALSGREQEVRAAIGADHATTDPVEGLRLCGLKTYRYAPRPDANEAATARNVLQSQAT